jgi:hypothetical protein
MAAEEQEKPSADSDLPTSTTGPSPRHRLEVTRGLNPYVERFRAVDVRPIASRLIIAALPRVQHVELDETAELDLSIQLYGFDLLRIDGRELLRSPLSTRRCDAKPASGRSASAGSA